MPPTIFGDFTLVSSNLENRVFWGAKKGLFGPFFAPKIANIWKLARTWAKLLISSKSPFYCGSFASPTILDDFALVSRYFEIRVFFGGGSGGLNFSLSPQATGPFRPCPGGGEKI